MDYLPYVQAHRDFYRPLEEADDIGTVYRASVVPDDWRRNQSGIWAMHRPPGAPNEAAARKLMEALARATSGEEGPYILGDRRWRESRVVSYRYGAAPHLDDPYSARHRADDRQDLTGALRPRPARRHPPHTAPAAHPTAERSGLTSLPEPTPQRA